MAAEIATTLGLVAELVKGSAGIFDVTADGETIFSKHEQQRFPDNAEVIAALRKRQASAP